MARTFHENAGLQVTKMRGKSRNIELDAMDWKILKALHGDGRLTNRQLAEAISLSPSGALSRVRRLETAGIIKGYRAVIDPGLGQRKIAMRINLALANHTQGHLRKLEKILLTTPEVTQASKVAGQTDYHIRVMVGTPDEWNEIAERWREAGLEFRTVETQVELHTIKDGGDWPWPGR
jgi:DNA-binding Lrp family transcriptional regulator